MDKRTQNTCERIRNAYIALLTDRGEPRLTVTAIARQANIDRKTFYLHYETVDDVMRDLICRIINDFVERLEARGFLENSLDVGIFYQTMGQILNEHAALFRFVATRPSMDGHWQQIKHELAVRLIERYQSKVVVKPDVLYVYVRFLLGGMQELYREWLRGGLELSIAELGRLSSDVAFEGFSPILK